MPHIPPQSFLDVANEAEATYYFSEWLGALFYSILDKKTHPFEEYIRKEYTIRNVMTGWSLQLGTIVMVIAFLSLLINS